MCFFSPALDFEFRIDAIELEMRRHSVLHDWSNMDDRFGSNRDGIAHCIHLDFVASIGNGAYHTSNPVIVLGSAYQFGSFRRH